MSGTPATLTPAAATTVLLAAGVREGEEEHDMSLKSLTAPTKYTQSTRYSWLSMQARGWLNIDQVNIASHPAHQEPTVALRSVGEANNGFASQGQPRIFGQLQAPHSHWGVEVDDGRTRGLERREKE